MKKWLIGCLMILLFAAPPALAGHNKPDGSVCNSEGYTVYGSNSNPTQHRMQCKTCGETIGPSAVVDLPPAKIRRFAVFVI